MATKRKSTKRTATKRVRSNGLFSTRTYRPQDLPNAHARKWYARGYAAGKRGLGGDSYAAWESAKGKPKGEPSHGRVVEAKEYFLGGYMDGRNERGNPAVRDLATGRKVKVSAVRVRTVRKGGKLQRVLDLFL